jgi:hypothetical protein
LAEPQLKALSALFGADVLFLEDGFGNVMKDQIGVPIWFTEAEARQLIGERSVRPRRHANGTRYLILRVKVADAQKSKVERFRELLEERIPLPVAKPYVVAEHIGGNRVYMHVAHRCSAAAPTRIPVSAGWM